MQLELYETPVDTPVELFLKKLHWIPVEHHCLKQPYLFTSFFPVVSPSICLYLLTVVLGPKLYPSTQKFAKQFGYSFAFEAPTV